MADYERFHHGQLWPKDDPANDPAVLRQMCDEPWPFTPEPPAPSIWQRLVARLRK